MRRRDNCPTTARRAGLASVCPGLLSIGWCTCDSERGQGGREGCQSTASEARCRPSSAKERPGTSPSGSSRMGGRKDQAGRHSASALRQVSRLEMSPRAKTFALRTPHTTRSGVRVGRRREVPSAGRARRCHCRHAAWRARGRRRAEQRFPAGCFAASKSVTPWPRRAETRAGSRPGSSRAAAGEPLSGGRECRPQSLHAAEAPAPLRRSRAGHGGAARYDRPSILSVGPPGPRMGQDVLIRALCHASPRQRDTGAIMGRVIKRPRTHTRAHEASFSCG